MSFLLIIILAALGLAAFEKLIQHRQNIIAMKLQYQGLADSEVRSQFEAMRHEIKSLKERVDEQAILIDDLSRTNPRADYRVEQRLNG